MVSGADRAGPLITGRSDSRVTALGALLRATKLDELPQLINVLRGDMTLIGPRPEVPRFIPCYSDEELKTLIVRPGIAGAGQIFYTQAQRTTVLESSDPEQHYVAHELHQKLATDLDYLRHRSLRFDLSIAIRTVLLFTELGKAATAVRQVEEPAMARDSRLVPSGTAQASATLAIQLPQPAVYLGQDPGSATATIPLPSAGSVSAARMTVHELNDQHWDWFYLELLVVILVAAMAGCALVLLIR
jgi:hypothetical protein